MTRSLNGGAHQLGLVLSIFLRKLFSLILHTVGLRRHGELRRRLPASGGGACQAPFNHHGEDARDEDAR